MLFRLKFFIFCITFLATNVNGVHDFMNLSVELEKAVRKEALYIKKLTETQPEVTEDQFVKSAVRRYERHWLPLTVKYPTLLLLPPDDVAFIWHTHRLSPLDYEDDILNRFGRVIGHDFVSEQPALDAMLAAFSRKIWNQNYPNELYDHWRATCSLDEFRYSQRMNYNLTDACRRRRSGTHAMLDIANEVLESEIILEQSVTAYLMWFQLVKYFDDYPLVPSKFVDIAWHAHQENPIAYGIDCYIYMGDVVDHNDDDLMVFGEDSDAAEVRAEDLEDGWTTTEKLWIQVYGNTSLLYL